MQLVDRTIAAEHSFDERGIPFDECLHRRAHLLFRQATHLQQTRLELLQFFLEVRNDAFYHGYPKRPVT